MMKNLLAAAMCLLCTVEAQAYEAGQTHAGLTEQAALTAQLNQEVVRVWGLRRGLFQEVFLRPAYLGAASRWAFLARFFQADPNCGCVPTVNYSNRALGWLVLGSVIEQLPPDRIRNHFFDPETGGGLSERKRYRSLARRVRWRDMVAGGGSLAGFVTGSNFDLTGRSALVWAQAKDNEFGLPALWKHFEASITASHRLERTHYVAMTLLAMGALAHLLEDMAAPSHVRNDFVMSHLLRGNPRGGSAYEAWVADRFGRFGLSRFKVRPLVQTRFVDFFAGPHGKGLAVWTAKRFLSIGSLPTGLPVTQWTRWLARHDRRLPPHRPFDMKAALAGPRYLWSADGTYRLAAYAVGPRGRLRFWMDRRVYSDCARRLLPAAVSYTAGLLRYFFRGRLKISGRRSGRLTISNQGVGLGPGRLLVLLETRTGDRRVVATLPIQGARSKGAVLARGVSVPRNGRAVALFVGRDLNSETIVAPSDQ